MYATDKQTKRKIVQQLPQTVPNMTEAPT